MSGGCAAGFRNANRILTPDRFWTKPAALNPAARSPGQSHWGHESCPELGSSAPPTTHDKAPTTHDTPPLTCPPPILS